MTAGDELPSLPFHPEIVAGTLSRHGVDYVIVGWTAVIMHGVAERETWDLDVVPELSERNLERLGAALRELNACVITHWSSKDQKLHVATSDFAPQVFRANPFLHLLTSAGRVDVLCAPGGVPQGYKQLGQRAEPYDLAGNRVLVAAIDDLVTMKRARQQRHPPEIARHHPTVRRYGGAHAASGGHMIAAGARGMSGLPGHFGQQRSTCGDHGSLGAVGKRATPRRRNTAARAELRALTLLCAGVDARDVAARTGLRPGHVRYLIAICREEEARTRAPAA